MEAQAGGDIVEAGVELDVFALLRGADGETEGLAGERWAANGDVGEPEREEGAWVELAVLLGVVVRVVTFIVAGPGVKVERGCWEIAFVC